jgi:vacuolar protein sorting-associated protein 13A/C
LNNFQTALNAIKAASAAAAEAAKQNMQQAYENATRVALDIEIKVCQLILIKSSKLLNALFRLHL